MKLLLTSLSIALASSTLASAAAAPAAAPAAPAVAASAEEEAPSAERLALARKFVALSNVAADPLDDMRTGFSYAVSQIEDAAQRTTEEAQMKRFFAALEPKVRKHHPAVVDAYVKAYAREFSAEELRQLIVFAQTPVGRRYIAEGSGIETDDLVIEAETELWEELEPAMDEIRKELCTEKAAQRIAAGDAKAKCPLSEPAIAQG